MTVTWKLSPDPPRIGAAGVTVALADSEGTPIEGADVVIEGTMTHPGMQPSISETEETVPGRYEGALELSMAGDWILILEAQLPDGRELRREHRLANVRPD